MNWSVSPVNDRSKQAAAVIPCACVWLVAHAIVQGFFTFYAHRALKLCMARSGAGLSPGLVRVIGRTRPWPGLAWGEPHGVPQHSSVDPPNTINHRGARGMQGPPPKSSHTATRRLPPRQSATGPTSLGARLAALGRAQHLEAMRCPCSRRRAHATDQPTHRGRSLGGGTCRPKACRPVAPRSP